MAEMNEFLSEAMGQAYELDYVQEMEDEEDDEDDDKLAPDLQALTNKLETMTHEVEINGRQSRGIQAIASNKMKIMKQEKKSFQVETFVKTENAKEKSRVNNMEKEFNKESGKSDAEKAKILAAMQARQEEKDRISKNLDATKDAGLKRK